MKKMLIVWTSFIVVLCFAGISGSFGNETELCVPMGVIVLSAPEKAEPKNAPVNFHHSKHFMYECRKCHHKWEGNTENLSCGTSNCHDLASNPQTEGKKAKSVTAYRYFKNAYHDQCIGCHKANKEKNAKLELSKKVLKSNLQNPGPTGCIECHPRQK
jgi:hypothetical protein